jgi:undecaprenyl-diphosphatase
MSESASPSLLARPRVAIALALAILFAGLAAFVASGAVDEWDQSTAGAVYDHRPEWAVGFFTAISFVGTYIGIIVGCSAACALLAARRRYGEAAFLAGCVGAIWIMNEAIKLAVARERPTLGSDPFATGYSFPSGHAMVGGAMVLLIAAIAAREARAWGAKAAVWTAAIALFALLAYSRIFLGVHYPTDVLGGALLAIAWTLAAGESRKWCISLRLKSLGMS